MEHCYTIYRIYNDAMRRLAAFSLFILINISFYSQHQFGFHSGISLNFETVNSIILNAHANQPSYIGLGLKYKPGLGFRLGIEYNKKINKKLDANFDINYILKNIRVFFQYSVDPENKRYAFDINYHYAQFPVYITYKRESKHIQYQIGFVNNILIYYNNQEKLYQTLMYQNIKYIHSYNIGFLFGINYPVFNRYDIFLRGETDLSPFLLTSDYGGDNLYPFKFHNITIGMNYWIQRNRSVKKTIL